MKAAIETGVNSGLTSGVITAPGLMVGLHAGTPPPWQRFSKTKHFM